MRIAFVDCTSWNYTPASAYETPLGGSQSAICYLSEQLALLGHDVRLFCGATNVSVTRGVTVAPLGKVSATAWQEPDVVIVQNWAKLAAEVRPLLRADARCILWTQHAHDQPAMLGLLHADFRDAHEAFVFVSDWQREQYICRFNVDPARSIVLRNAVSPAFEGLFMAGEAILAAKDHPPVLAYTSTPFRGLDVLLEVFPRIRSVLPGVALHVFSSMKVYQMAAERDARQYGALYDRCRSLPGVRYFGSLAQPELARALRAVSVLAYPNTFAETSCIAAMEALASGCRVVTSDLGALPETTSGFATLIAGAPTAEEYRNQFAAAVIAAVQDSHERPAVVETRLREQIDWINTHGTWKHRALEWHHWLTRL